MMLEQAMGFYNDRIVPHLVNLAMRNRQLAPYRERVLAHSAGRVLEIGVGSGLNLPLYTDHALEIVGLEPHPKLLKMASEKVGPVPAGLIERVGFAVLGLVIKAIDETGTAAGANGLKVILDARIVADIKSIAQAVKSAVPVAAAKIRQVHLGACF